MKCPRCGEDDIDGPACSCGLGPDGFPPWELSPGPWSLGEQPSSVGLPIIEDANGVEVCSFGWDSGDESGAGSPPSPADLALILAAPELLDALKLMLAPVPDGESWAAFLVRREANARAIIAKATNPEVM